MTILRKLTTPRVDPPMLLAVVALVIIGVVMVASSSTVFALQTYGDPWFFAKRQAVFAIFGVVALALAAAIPPQFWERNALRLLGFAFALLVAVMLPGIGHTAGGARRWIQLGPVLLQAGEIMKVALVVWLASSLARKMGEPMRRFTVGVLPHFLIPGAAIALLLLEPDFGTSAMLLLLTFLMLFVAGARIGYLFGGALAAFPIALHFVASSDYRMKRVLAFLDPWAHRRDIGYQITESLMTFGSGQFFGLGLGESKQKLFFLPAAHTDFIFAIIGEEFGFLGVVVVLGCFALISWRALQAAIRLNRPFSSYLTLGLASLLLVQALFNVSVVLGLVPTKGITLPFVSYGGSSLIASMFIAGMLLRLTSDGLSGRPDESAGRGGYPP